MKLETLINTIKVLTNEKDLDKIIKEATKRQSYLESGDLEKLCLDLIEKIGFGECVILQGFSREKDGKYVPIKEEDLIDGNLFLYGIPGSKDYPVNTFLGEYLSDPEVNEIWDTIKKVYKDIRYEDDLESVNEDGNYDSSEVFVALFVDDADYSTYFDLITT